MSYNNDLQNNNTELRSILAMANNLPEVGAGENGATFTPAVSTDGVISWTNDKGLDNPAPVNIKGPKGESVSVVEVQGSNEPGGENIVKFSDGAEVIILNGRTGTAGSAGASVTVKSVSQSNEDGGSNVVTFSDDKTLVVKNGSKGSKGDNYVLTEADKAEIASGAVGKMGLPTVGEVGQVLAVKSVDANGKPTEFACVYQAAGDGNGGEAEVIEKTFKVWGPEATGYADGDIVTGLNSGYYDKNGTQVETGTFGCTVPLIKINEDATIYAYNLYDFEAGYAITFFDSNITVISGVGGNGNTSTRISGSQTVPNGARYVAVTLLKADPGMYCQITTRETVVTNDYGTQIGFLTEDVASLKTEVDEITEKMDGAYSETVLLDYASLLASVTEGYYDTNGELLSTSAWKCTNYIPVSGGDLVTVKLTTYNTANAISYFDINHRYIGGVVGDTWSWSTTLYPLDETVIVPEGAYFMRISVFVADYAAEQSVSIERSVTNRIKNNLDVLNVKPLNILVLGDSYSETGRWIEHMNEVIDINSVVNLGVTSATIKDLYTDRAAYPYSSRPKTAGGGGNTNTLACQIQMLKRLMAGTDLDAGESKIYKTADEYPNVIIIEGGMNDSPDSDSVVEKYHEQFMISKTAYYKAHSSAPVTQTTVWVKPSLDSVDRTSFAGAYRYICEELYELFPNAQIFITTASHMNYFTINPNERYGKIAEQQRKCADIMSYTVIDWHGEGNLNTIMIGLNGSGTQSDPYTPVGGDQYTTDLLHPNDNGAIRYGRLAGKVIKEKFLGLS